MTGYEGTLDRQQILAGWLEGTRSGLELYGARRDFALDPEPRGLSWFMDFDSVIYSWGDGRHAQEVRGLWAPEAVCYRDEHGEWLDPDLNEGPNGWSLMSGYSGQHAYSGPWMHQSEYIGGRMAEDILNTCGFFVAIYPHYAGGNDDEDASEDPDTWAVAYISENIPGSA